MLEIHSKLEIQKLKIYLNLSKEIINFRGKRRLRTSNRIKLVSEAEQQRFNRQWTDFLCKKQRETNCFDCTKNIFVSANCLIQVSNSCYQIKWSVLYCRMIKRLWNFEAKQRKRSRNKLKRKIWAWRGKKYQNRRLIKLRNWVHRV